MFNIITDCRFAIKPIADFTAGKNRNFLGVVKNDCFNFIFKSIIKLIAVALKNLNSVIFARIVRSRNHNARLTAIFINQISNCRSRDNAYRKNVTSNRAKPRRKCRFKHISRSTSILTDKNRRLCRFAFLKQNHSRRSAYLECKFRSQINICNSSYTVCTKKSTHNSSSFLYKFNYYKSDC